MGELTSRVTLNIFPMVSCSQDAKSSLATTLFFADGDAVGTIGFGVAGFEIGVGTVFVAGLGLGWGDCTALVEAVGVDVPEEVLDADCNLASLFKRICNIVHIK